MASSASALCINVPADFVQDKYGNPVEEGYDGEVMVTICGPPSGAEVPTLVGGARSVVFHMRKGQATVQVSHQGGSLWPFESVHLWDPSMSADSLFSVCVDAESLLSVGVDIEICNIIQHN